MLIDRVQKIMSWHFTLCKSVRNIDTVAAEMQVWLRKMEGALDWKIAAWECLDVAYKALSKEGESKQPEMACRRSGNCCVKQVPRASLFEIEQMAQALDLLPTEEADKIMQRCRDSVVAEYKDPILGEGVPCPVLGKDERGVHVCSLHAQRPYACRLSALSTPMSWDCPLWEVHGTHFPTIDASLVRPFLTLFAYCRNFYAKSYIGNNERRQMMLVGAGILALRGERPPVPRNNIVTSVLPHAEKCAEDLYLRTMEPPPKKETS